MWNKVKCWWIGHVWTCRAIEGLPPLPEDRVDENDSSDLILKKFQRYSTMYCKRCGKRDDKGELT